MRLHSFLLIGLHPEALNGRHLVHFNRQLLLRDFLGLLNRLHLYPVQLLLGHGRPDLLQYRVALLLFGHVLLLVLVLRVSHLPLLLLDLSVALRLEHLLLHSGVLEAPLLDLLDFSDFFLAPALINLVLNLVPHLLFFCEVELVELVELLALAELALLFLELFSHAELAVPGGHPLVLLLLVGAQNGVLVQRGPFVDFIVEAAHDAVGIIIVTFILLHDAKVLLQPLLEEGGRAGQALQHRSQVFHERSV